MGADARRVRFAGGRGARSGDAAAAEGGAPRRGSCEKGPMENGGQRADMDSLFGEGGALSKARPGFEFRPGQRAMAEAVAEVFAAGGRLVVEAGTGTGKTLAYLAPALLADAPVVVSTGTKALQEQILSRELPVAFDVVGGERRAAVLKGRENYLCLKRFDEMRAEPLLDRAGDAPLWRAIEAWAARTETGDRAEIEDLPDRSLLWSRLDGRTEICIGRKCPRFDRCFVFRARQEAAKAQIVVVNHHLLFADLALRRSGGGGILPDAPYVVFDEAHLIEDAASSHFGRKLSGRMIADLAGDAEREFSAERRPTQTAKRTADWGKEFFRALRAPRFGRGRFDAGAFLERCPDAAEELREALARLAAALGEGNEEREDERTLLAGRAVHLANVVDELTTPPPADQVVTVEGQGKDGALLVSWPLDVAGILEETVAGSFEGIVATSATLSVAGSLERARRTLGLPDARTLIVPSPFDHRRQAALYVPREFPEPSNPRFAERALEEIEELLKISGGRALVLFASHRALEEAAERFRGQLPWPVLVQGDAPRERLVAEFRRDVRSVLLGTASFRQGIDVPGEALSLVVVDKLPFAVPDDPVVAARGELLRARGGDPFREQSLPEAVLALKQGLGRLIRSRADRGLLALLDVRVRTKFYGKTVLRSLPPWPLLDDVDAARRWFDEKVGPAADE